MLEKKRKVKIETRERCSREKKRKKEEEKKRVDEEKKKDKGKLK